MDTTTGPEEVPAPQQDPEEAFRRDIEAVINRHSRENGSNTPDHILAIYLANCLRAFDMATHAREYWYGRVDRNGTQVS